MGFGHGYFFGDIDDKNSMIGSMFFPWINGYKFEFIQTKNNGVIIMCSRIYCYHMRVEPIGQRTQRRKTQIGDD